VILTDAIARRVRYTDRWLVSYALWRLRRAAKAPPRHVWLAVADHHEPLWNGADPQTARRRVAEWRRRWPEIASRHADADGRPPVHTFFYPQEEYRPELMASLAEMCRLGIADVEVHIHHDGDGEERFLEKMGRFLETLHADHGLLRRDDGRIAFGFIHGNWALDNSRPDGRWCGLDNEISLLLDLGCYADFTMPAANSPCQGGPVNTIFTVRDDPARPRSHAHGVPLRAGVGSRDELTLIPGPLGLDFSSRGPLRPHIECGEVAGYRPASRERARLWLRLAPRLGHHAFLKLFTHGAQERNSGPMLAGGLDGLFEALAAECAARGARLHFVSAYEMWRAVGSVRSGDDPGTRPASAEVAR
jgi:hypothetical protein